MVCDFVTAVPFRDREFVLGVLPETREVELV